MMEYSIHYNPELNCVFCAVKGNITSWSDVENFAAEVSEILSIHSCGRLLNDLSQVPLKMWDIGRYHLPDLIESVDIPRACKRALVIPSADIEDYRFFESTAVNRGFSIKVFLDMESAWNWLGLLI